MPAKSLTRPDEVHRRTNAGDDASPKGNDAAVALNSSSASSSSLAPTKTAKIERLRDALNSMGVNDYSPPSGVDRKISSSAADEVFQRILVLCGYQDYSRKKMTQRLVREGRDPKLCAEALDRAVAIGIIDDARFAELLIRSRLQQGKGLMGIERELSEHAIEARSVDGWPEAFTDGEEAEVSRAVALLRRHPPRSKHPRDSAYRRLVGKGYASSIASKAAAQWYESQAQDRSEDAAIL